MDYITFCENNLGPGRKVGKKDWVFECPNGCGKKLWVDSITGLYQCFICNDGRKIRGKLAEARRGVFFGSGNIEILKAYFHEDKPLVLNKPLDEEVFPTSERRLLLTEYMCNPELTEEHKEYLCRRGFCSERWGIDFGENPLRAMSSEILRQRLSNIPTLDKRRLGIYDSEDRYSFWLRPGRILIPYYSKSGIVLGVRARSTFVLSQSKYLWLRDTAGSRLTYSVRELGEKVIITEGEFKSALPTLLGFPAVGIPGITTGIEACVSMLVRSGVKHAVICLDSENPGASAGKKKASEGVENSAALLRYLLEEAGVSTERFILPLEDKDKQDLDGFLLDEGIPRLEDELHRQCPKYFL